MLIEIRHSRYTEEEADAKGNAYYKCKTKAKFETERSGKKLEVKADLSGEILDQLKKYSSTATAYPVVETYATAVVHKNPQLKRILRDMLVEIDRSRVKKVPELKSWVDLVHMDVRSKGRIPASEYAAQTRISATLLPFLAIAVVRLFAASRLSRSITNDLMLAAVVARENQPGPLMVPTDGQMDHSTLPWMTTYGFNPDLDWDKTGTAGKWWDLAIGMGQRHKAIWMSVRKRLAGISPEYHETVGRYALGRFPWWLQAILLQANITNRVQKKSVKFTERAFRNKLTTAGIKDMDAFDAFYWYYLNGQPALLRRPVSDLENTYYIEAAEHVFNHYHDYYEQLPADFFKTFVYGPYDPEGTYDNIFTGNEDRINSLMLSDRRSTLAVLDSWIGVPNLMGLDVRKESALTDELLDGYVPKTVRYVEGDYSFWCEYGEIGGYAEPLELLTRNTVQRLIGAPVMVPIIKHRVTPKKGSLGIKTKIEII